MADGCRRESGNPSRLVPSAGFHLIIPHILEKERKINRNALKVQVLFMVLCMLLLVTSSAPVATAAGPELQAVQFARNETLYTTGVQIGRAHV